MNNGRSRGREEIEWKGGKGWRDENKSKSTETALRPRAPLLPHPTRAVAMVTCLPPTPTLASFAGIINDV